MNLKISGLIISLVFLNGCATKGDSASPVESVKVGSAGTLLINPIVFKEDAFIREAVKKECNLPSKLTQFIEQNAATQYTEILSDSNVKPQNAQILTIEIVQVQGSGGGAWSGAKDVVVRGQLTKNGKKLGNFKGRRYSGGGMFGAYKGTCAILGRCVRTLGKDIATWLKNPTSQAMLGDM